MNKQQIISTLRQPHHLNEQTLDQMKEILDEYPFFQAGRMLWVMNLHLLGHIRYNNELKLAAAHIASRARLFDLLHVPVQPSLEQPADFNEEVDSEVPPAAANDYFVADEVFETESGNHLDFSRTFEEEPENLEEEIKYAFPHEAENIVLPSADLLGFEMSGTTSYSLPEEETADWDEARSFSGWLSVLKNQPAIVPSSDTTSEGDEQSGNKMSLIDSFLAGGMNKRRIVPVKPQDKQDEIVDISAKSLQENEDLMTETLANIYIKQQHFLKAIDIFERLRLKYPEKSIYFARRIKELEDQINNQ
jgi:hypothetical protein